MLQTTKHLSYGDRDVAPSQPSTLELAKRILAIVRRQMVVIILFVAVGAGLGLLYLLTAPPRYTATATMVMDTRKVQLFQQQSVLGDISVDAGTVETQVEILKSENISLSVIKDRHLTEDPEFVGPSGGFIGSAIGFLRGLFDPDSTPSEFDLTRAALSRFEANRTIKRIGLTYVMEIGFRSLNPDKAAEIANAIADAYIVDQLEAKYQATRRASVWLQDRIRELRTQASAAEKAVIDYKEKNNIVDTGGRLMSEQQLAEINSQLILARASTAEARARFDRINDIMRQDVPNQSVADALKNETIIKLRGQYVDLAAREANWSEKYGHNHLAAVNLRNQMQEIRRNITQELQRIQQAYQSDYDIARAREDSIKKSLETVVSEAQTTNQAQVQMRELESNAQTYRAMYDNFLQRYMEAVQQQSFPITEARLISPASRPLKKSDPKTLLVLGFALAASMVLGVGVAYARELNDNVFRTSAQVEQETQVNCIAVLPAIGRPSVAKSGMMNSVFGRSRAEDRRPVDTGPMLLSYVVHHPLSRFAEAVRAMKVAADMHGMVRPTKVIGVTSTMPGEGKSTIAANFAQLIAHAGGKVVLVDADLRSPSLSRSMTPDVSVGLVDAIAERMPLSSLLIRDAATGLMFLPAGATSRLLHTNEILASAGMQNLIETLRSTYNYVIIDLPPLAPVVDVRATTGIIDAYVFAVEWGRTKVDVIEHALLAASGVYSKIMGVVLNKADTNLLNQYEYHQGSRYYRTHYAQYGYLERENA